MQLLWSLLNGALLLAFGLAIWRAVSLLRRAGHGLLALVLGLGVLGLAGSSAPPAGNVRNLLRPESAPGPVGNWSAVVSRPLSLSTKANLVLEARRDSATVRPTGLFFTASGLTLGHRWQPLAGSVARRGDSLAYYVAIRHEWRLLGWPVFASSEEYQGRQRWR